METKRDIAWLCLSLLLLLFGWLAPGYASKCIGKDLASFFSESPFTAALIGQAGFILLAVLPRPADVESRTPVSTQCQPISCNRFSLKAFRVGLPLGVLVVLVHSAWYASIPRTTVGMNTVLWNSDTVTTPLVYAVISWHLPSLGIFCGGSLGLIGVVLSMNSSQEGNTMLGCSLVFVASLLYAFQAVIIERLKNRNPNATSVVELLVCEGVVALILLLLYAVGMLIFNQESFWAWHALFPAPSWLILIVFCTIFLNVGWLWCTELAGASWAAVAASLSIPMSMVLDYTFLGIAPCLMTISGACFILGGFVVVSFAEKSQRLARNMSDEAVESELVQQ